jgi:glycosyltransferase involved in cell wall biosynthesis
MRILYDHRVLSDQASGGITRYFCELYSNLKLRTNVYPEISVLYCENVHYTDMMRSKPPLCGTNFKGKWYAVRIANELLTRYKLSSGKYDIFHPTYFDTYHIGLSPYVITVYDMIYELYPEYFVGDPIAETKKTVVENADKIIAISENTKNDIVSIYEIDPDLISVTPLATSLGDATPETIGIPPRYILFVGNRWWYKNFEVFARAMTMLLHEDSELKIICAGSSDFNTSELNLFKSLGISNSVLHCNIRSDGELSSLYRNALAFVFPSLYEGFGIPTLEAMSCGCPVVASSRSSIPEVAGTAAVYFNPEDSCNMADAVAKVIYSPKIREDLIRKGHIQNAKFSWDKTADKTLAVYEEMIS